MTLTNPLLSRCESLLARMEALEERGTKGEWTACVDGVYAPTEGHCEHCSYEPQISEPREPADRFLIAFSRNHSKTERELVREVLSSLKACDTCAGGGLEEINNALCFGENWVKIQCRVCGGRITALTRWADSTEAELGKVGA